ncbi:MAG: hypothetical protein K9G70_15285, partial [Prolixibacteraceae bacterium]|nr:hypothetical protein [Prolixibacteraceae bacterium]
ESSYELYKIIWIRWLKPTAMHMLRLIHNASYGFFIASVGIGFSLTMVTTSESSYELPSALADGMELVIKLELAGRIA